VTRSFRRTQSMSHTRDIILWRVYAHFKCRDRRDTKYIIIIVWNILYAGVYCVDFYTALWRALRGTRIHTYCRAYTTMTTVDSNTRQSLVIVTINTTATTARTDVVKTRRQRRIIGNSHLQNIIIIIIIIVVYCFYSFCPVHRQNTLHLNEHFVPWFKLLLLS